MLLLDQPYVSDLLRRTVHGRRLPVVLTDAARRLGFADATVTVTEDEARDRLRADPHARLLSNSENALDWVALNLPDTPLAAAAKVCKDKALFREKLSPLHPDLRFRTLDRGDLADLDIANVGHAFVVKPAVGFFSLGVRVVHGPDDWPRVRRELAADLERAAGIYPQRVLDASRLIVEELVTGEEYAVDAYYDDAGRVVVTGILHHRFGSAHDVGDRVYTTGEAIVASNLERFGAYLEAAGRLLGLRSFPVHVELRVDDAGRIVPIEFNPLRFGGWCTTADLTALALGFDPYTAFLRDARPDWEAIFATRRDRLYSVIVLDNSTGYEPRRVAAFDHERVAARFHRTLAVRPVDHRRYGVFGFLFTETPAAEAGELDAILRDDLRDYVTLDDAGAPPLTPS
jgi:hypothetical protein